jgi:hypothetical protein
MSDNPEVKIIDVINKINADPEKCKEFWGGVLKTVELYMEKQYDPHNEDYRKQFTEDQAVVSALCLLWVDTRRQVMDLIHKHNTLAKSYTSLVKHLEKHDVISCGCENTDE